jgi:hypothetical protein
MAISFSLPENVENDLRIQFHDLDQAAKEAALVELYRLGSLSHGQFADGLGVSRYDADAVLKRHGVCEDLISAADFDAQVAGLRKTLGE